MPLFSRLMAQGAGDAIKGILGSTNWHWSLQDEGSKAFVRSFGQKYGIPPSQAARNGIGLVPEDRRIIQGLIVEENLKLAQIAPPHGWSLDRICDLFPRLAERRNQEGTTMSGGEQQMLALARILARDVKLLLLDEPYEGLNPIIVQEIERTLEEIKSHSMTTIIVE